ARRQTDQRHPHPLGTQRDDRRHHSARGRNDLQPKRRTDAARRRPAHSHRNARRPPKTRRDRKRPVRKRRTEGQRDREMDRWIDGEMDRRRIGVVPLSLCPSVPLSLCPSFSLSLCPSVFTWRHLCDIISAVATSISTTWTQFEIGQLSYD